MKTVWVDRFKKHLPGFLLIWVLLLPVRAGAQPTATTYLQRFLYVNSIVPDPDSIFMHKLARRSLVLKFYFSNQFELAWTNQADADTLVAMVEQARYEGLNPTDYHALQIAQLKDCAEPDALEFAMRDLLLTDAFLTYASHLSCGRLDPEKLYPGKWERKTCRSDLVEILIRALKEGNVDDALRSLRPAIETYRQLTTQLRRLHEDNTDDKMDSASTIAINLERLRWLPDSLGATHVVVDITDFRLHVIHRHDSLMDMRAIVGRPDRSTPVFSSVINYVILNPTWTVPPTILHEDVLPAVRNDSNYLTKHHLRVFTRKGTVVNPSDIPWDAYTGRTFPYQIRQDPGPFNSLGLIKFFIPNHYTVFLHDTNAPSLFSVPNRALSSGCIRIQSPLALAAFLLQPQGWTEDEIRKVIKSGKTTTVRLSRGLPVHIIYLTAYAADGKLQWRDDIYGMDAVLRRALNVTP